MKRKNKYFLTIVVIMITVIFSSTASAYTKLSGVTTKSSSFWIQFSGSVPDLAITEFGRAREHYKAHNILFSMLGPMPDPDDNGTFSQNNQNFESSGAAGDGKERIYYNSRGTGSYLMATRYVISNITHNIISFDMDINASYDFGRDEWYNTKYDYQACFTHEFGHFLGLDHSSNADATMYPTMSKGEIKKRDLHSDDINGFKSLGYPAN